ncbi:MAG: MFS transporter [Bryobacteraceae bacterium]
MTGGRTLILAAWLGICVYGYLNAMLGIVLPNLMEKLRLDKSQAGTFFMISSVGLIVSSIPSGVTMDVFGTKVIVCVGLFFVAVAFWGLGAINSSRWLYPLAFVLGLGGAMIVAGENTTISLSNPSQREIAANLLNLFFGVGAFIAPFIVMPVLRRWGFSGVLKVSSVFTGLVLLFHLALSFPRPELAQTFPLARAGALISEPRLWMLMCLVFLYVGTEFSVWSWTVTFLTTERGYAQKSASRIISLFALAMIAGRWASQWTLDRFGPERVLLISAAGAVICLAGMFGFRARKGIVLFSLGAGWFMAAIFPTALGLAGRYFPTLVGTAISLVTTGGWLGAVVIPPAVGFVADRRGVARGVLVPVGSAFLMVLAPIGLLFWR